jgi:hypothetical protein
MANKNSKNQKKTDKINKIANYYELELKRNYVKAISQGYKLALKDILSLLESQTDGDDIYCNIKTFCDKELNLRKNMEKGIDGEFDRKEEKLNETE